jgi:tetratricopeptide (TPR) repeat protein
MRYNHLRFSVFILLVFLFSGIRAQETVFYAEPGQTYRQAMDLFTQKAYGPSGKLFDEYIRENQNHDDVFVENAAYYKLVCAVEMKNSDALSLAVEFAKEYPESAHLESVYFESGRLYFDKRKYRPALEAFKNVKPNKLSAEQRAEYYYKSGFCFLKINKPDNALANFKRVLNTNGPYAAPSNYYYAHIQYLKHNYDEALEIFKKIENNRRFKKYIPDYLIHIYFEKKEYQKVVDQGEKFYRNASSKSKGEIARLIANSYFELENYDKAYDYFKLYERSTKSISPEENYKIGIVKYKKAEFNGAIGNFQRATKVKSEIAQSAWYHLGYCYLNTEQDKFARDAFLKAWQMKSEPEVTTDALFSYVKTTIKTGGDPYNDELKILQSFINDNQYSPRINEAYDLLVQLFLTSKNYLAALESIDKSENVNRRLQTVYQNLAYSKGVELFRRSDYNGANQFFDKALKYPVDKSLYAKTLFWKGDANYQLRRFSTADKFYRRFLKQRSAVSSGLYSTALYNLGYTAFNQRNYSAAIQNFDKFIRYGRSDEKLIMDARLRMADSYYIQKNFLKAASLYDVVVRNGAQDADYALYQKASCYGAQGNFDKKIDALSQFVHQFRHSPSYTDVLYEIGSTYLVLHDQRHAISSFDKLVKENPRSVYAKKALTKIGLLYYNNNQYREAIKVLKQVVSKYPASSEATEALNTLKSIYTETGKVDEYFAYAKGLNFIQVSTSEQDSLTFVMGENYYIGNNCNGAIDALSKYVSKFPKGGFVLKSYYYLADCFGKQNDRQRALAYYEKILDFPDNEYTVKALLMAARLEFDNKDFSKSLDYYAQLEERAETKSIVLESLDGMMRSAFYTDNKQKAAEAAKKLLKTAKVSEDQIVFAHYVIAKDAYERNKFDEANKEFTITDKLTSGEWGAEAKYYQALIAFNNKDDKEAEDLVYQLADQYSDYEYWVAKGFILLSDIYMMRDNSFQAEQTLNSVIENYQGDDDLKQIAREKLNRIERLKPADDEEKEVGNE